MGFNPLSHSSRQMFIALSRLFIILMLALASSGAGAAVSETRTISVSGLAEVKVTPDEIVLRMGAESRDKSVAIAKRQNDEAIARVMGVAKRFGIDSGSISTGYLGVEPRYKTVAGGSYGMETTQIDFFSVRRDLAISLKDVSKFEGFLSAIVEAGANRVSQVSFNTSELRLHQDRARQLALVNAREKASVMARELGQKIGRPVKIVEDGALQNDRSRVFNMYETKIVEANFGSQIATALGQIAVSAGVLVEFELVE